MKNAKQLNIYKLLRQIWGLSLNALSLKSGVSSVYLNQLETGVKSNPSDEILAKIAGIYGIKVSTLKFFLSKQEDESEFYRNYVLSSLEEYAQNTKKH